MRRCLAKDPDRRYQSIKEVAIEIDELREDLKRSTASRDSSPEAISSTSTASDAASQQLTALQESPVSTQVSATPTSSSKVLLSEIKRHKTGAVLSASFIVLLIVVAAYGAYKLLGGRTSDNVDPSRMKISRLTTGG